MEGRRGGEKSICKGTFHQAKQNLEEIWENVLHIFERISDKFCVDFAEILSEIYQNSDEIKKN